MDDGTDDGNKKPRTSRPKQHSATPEGEPLWSKNSRNPALETEEYLRRSRIIKENPHLEGCKVPLAQWEEAFPGEGEMIQRWYKQDTRVLVTNEVDFHLDVLIYCDYSGRELGEVCQQFSDYCLDRVGNARISFPTRYSIAMEAVYHHRNFKMYAFLYALDTIIANASRKGKRHEKQNSIRARRLQEILESNYSLTTSTKSNERDIIQEEGYEVSYNSLFLEFAGVPPSPKLRVYPNVNKVCEAITAAVKETYAPESKASQLLVALQRGLCEKVKSTPELFKSLATNQRNDMYSYRAFTELLARDGKDCDKCTTVQSGTAEAAGDAFYQPIHNMSIDHNGLMAVWLKHLYQGKSPSASSWDALMAQYALSQVFEWMAEWGNNNDEMMNWDQFNQDLSPLTRVNAHHGINGKCSLEMPCISHHLCKDCSKGTRHLAGAALPGEVSSHAMRTINHKITNKLKMDVSNGKSALSNYCFTYLELPGVSFHHTSALSPVSVMEASKCRELMLDMKKEVRVSKLRHTASSQRRDEDVAAAAREVAVTAVVWENDHRLLHKIDNIDIGERPYNVANNVMVVNADEQREFTELFDIITEESDSTSTTGLTVTVRIVSGRAISIVPLLINNPTSHDKDRLAFAKYLFKLNKTDLYQVIQKLNMNCPEALVQTSEEVKINVDLISQIMLDGANDASTSSEEANDSPSRSSSIMAATEQVAELVNPPTYEAEAGSVILISSEGHSFTVNMDIANMSRRIKDEINGASSGVIHLPNVKTAVLERVVAFCTHYQISPVTAFGQPLDCTIFPTISDWYAEFLRMGRNLLYHLIVAANHLGIKSLVDLTCACVASAVTGKSPDEVRQILNPKDDASLLTLMRNDNASITTNYVWALGKGSKYNIGESIRLKNHDDVDLADNKENLRSSINNDGKENSVSVLKRTSEEITHDEGDRNEEYRPMRQVVNQQKRHRTLEHLQGSTRNNILPQTTASRSSGAQPEAAAVVIAVAATHQPNLQAPTLVLASENNGHQAAVNHHPRPRLSQQDNVNIRPIPVVARHAHGPLALAAPARAMYGKRLGNLIYHPLEGNRVSLVFRQKRFVSPMNKTTAPSCK